MESTTSSKTIDDVCAFLQTRHIDRECQTRFRDNKIDGNVVKMMSDRELEEMGVAAFGDRILLRRFCHTNSPQTTAIQTTDPQPDEQTSAGDTSIGSRRKKLLQLLKAATKEPSGKIKSCPRQYGRPKKAERSITLGLRLNTGRRDKTGGRDAHKIKAPLGDKDVIVVKFGKQSKYEVIKDTAIDKFFPRGENAVLGKTNEFNFEIVNSRNENVQENLSDDFTLEDYIDTKMIPGAIRLYLLCPNKTVHSEGESGSSAEVEPVFPTQTDDTDPNWLPDLSPPKQFARTSMSGEVWLRTRNNRRRHTLVTPEAVTESSSEPFCSGYNRQMQYAGIIDISDTESEENEGISISIAESLSDEERNGVPSLEGCLNTINMEIDQNLSPNLLNVVRGRLLDGASRAILRKSFDPSRPLSVVFMDDMGVCEGAVDHGGPKREFFTFIMQEIQRSSMFAGEQTDKCIVPSKIAEDKDLYFVSGRIIALAVAHKCQGPHFFSNIFYDMVSKGCDNIHASLGDVRSHDIREKLHKIESATSMQELHEAVNDANEFLELAGCLGPITKMDHKEKVLQAAVDFHVIYRSRHCLERFNQGLEALNVLKTVREHPLVMKELFCSTRNPVSLKEIQDLFVPILAETGGNLRAKQNITLSYWRDYLIDINDGEADVMLKDILMFATGAEELPPCGYDNQPSLDFIDGSLPSANTCSCILRVPMDTRDYTEFKQRMDFGILNSPGFGVA